MKNSKNIQGNVIIVVLGCIILATGCENRTEITNIDNNGEADQIEVKHANPESSDLDDSHPITEEDKPSEIADQGNPRPVEATSEEHAFIEDGTVMISPVSGKTITKNSRTPALVYLNRLYFFCCRVDMRKFMENPGQYVDLVEIPNGMNI